MRAALYLRVSKKDDSQTTENQMLQLRQYVEARGWELVAEFVDNESGRRGRGERKGFDAMFKAAHKRAFDVLVFWALDRFSREGVAMSFHYFRRLDSCGVLFHSYQDEYLTTATTPEFRDMLLSIASTIAASESKRISERTKAGLERAKKGGKKLGRPSKKPIVLQYLRTYWHQGNLLEMSRMDRKREIQGMIKRDRNVSVSMDTIHRCVKAFESEPQAGSTEAPPAFVVVDH